MEVVEAGALRLGLHLRRSRRGGARRRPTLPDQVPHEVKRERMERLVEAVQRHATERAQRFVGRTMEVLVEGPSRTDPSRLRGRIEAQQDGELRRRGRAGRAGPRGDRVGHEHHARGRGGPARPSGRLGPARQVLWWPPRAARGRRRPTRGGRPRNRLAQAQARRRGGRAGRARDEHHVRAPALLGGHEPGIAQHLAGEGLGACQTRLPRWGGCVRPRRGCRRAGRRRRRAAAAVRSQPERRPSAWFVRPSASPNRRRSSFQLAAAPPSLITVGAICAETLPGAPASPCSRGSHRGRAPPRGEGARRSAGAPHAGPGGAGTRAPARRAAGPPRAVAPRARIASSAPSVRASGRSATARDLALAGRVGDLERLGVLARLVEAGSAAGGEQREEREGMRSGRDIADR